MKPRIMRMEEDWEDIKNNQLAYLLEEEGERKDSVVMMVGGNDKRETMLKSLVQQAARN